MQMEIGSKRVPFTNIFYNRKKREKQRERRGGKSIGERSKKKKKSVAFH